MTWTEKRWKYGMMEWRLACRLARVDHRPTVSLLSDGSVYAKARSGYVREFTTVEEAKGWIEDREK